MNVQNHNRQVGCGKSVTSGRTEALWVVVVVESCATPIIGETKNT